MSDHSQPETPYNPGRDYSQFMHWAKWGGAIFIAIVLVLRFVIG